MRQYRLLLFILPFIGFTSCDKDSSAGLEKCDRCQIDEIYDEVVKLEKVSKGRELSTELTNTINATVKRVINEELEIKAGASSSNSKVMETYRRILPANSDIVQQVNAYRQVACSFEKFYCKSVILNDTSKHEKIEQVLNEFRKNIFDIFQNKNTQGDSGESNTPRIRPQPRTLTYSDNTFPSKPKSSPTLQYVTTDQHHDVAILAKGKQADNLGGAMRMELNRKGYMTSRNYFSSAFLSAFDGDVWDRNISKLSQLDLAPKLNCICTIDSDLDARTNTFQGRNYTELSGTTRIQLILLQSSESFEYTISKSGSGPESELSAALEDYTRKLFNSDEFSKIPFSLCK